MTSAVSASDRDRLMANGLAHKIRNSLNAMRAHLALLHKFSPAEPGSRAAHHLSRLEQAVTSVEQLLNDYLAIASPETGEWRECDLRALVEEIIGFTSLDMEQSKVDFQLDFPKKLPPLLADPSKLKWAILNLVVNARQALPEGGRIVVRAERPRRGWVALEIVDSGCGIPEDERPRIFDPFFSTKSDAIGLGLPVAQRIVADLHGKLDFESQVGQGSTFRVTLPTAARQRAFMERSRRRAQWLEPVPKEK
jgi:signal transduction histidine kinase